MLLLHLRLLMMPYRIQMRRACYRNGILSVILGNKIKSAMWEVIHRILILGERWVVIVIMSAIMNAVAVNAVAMKRP